MKKIALLLYLPALLISGELKDALYRAKQENKPLMIYVKSDSCQFCDKMKKNTLNTPLIQESMKGFIFATADKNGEEAKKYLPKTRYTPTVYFIKYEAPKFKAVNIVKGYLGKDDFNLWITDTRQKLGMDGTSTVEAPQEEISTTPRSDIWMYDIASGLDYASQTGKQLMVYVDSPDAKWGKWPKKMENETLATDSIKEALSNFVWVRIQKGSAEAKAYGLNPNLIPSTYFMKSDGKDLAKAEGYFNTQDFMIWINYAKSKLK